MCVSFGVVPALVIELSVEFYYLWGVACVARRRRSGPEALFKVAMTVCGRIGAGAVLLHVQKRDRHCNKKYGFCPRRFLAEIPAWAGACPAEASRTPPAFDRGRRGRRVDAEETQATA